MGIGPGVRSAREVAEMASAGYSIAVLRGAARSERRVASGELFEVSVGSIERLAGSIPLDAQPTVRPAATSSARMGTGDSLAVLAKPSADWIVVFAFPLEGSTVVMDGGERTTLEELRAALASRRP